MTEKNTIRQIPQLPIAQDYELLRLEALSHIESLARDVWTDYNAHDPGITILEELCYAMTEAGYRCGFEMKDLLTKADGKTVDDQVLFTAKKILTNNPLTINDYRKVLIDIRGVHNAWLFADTSKKNDAGIDVPINEVPIYADCKNDQLTFELGPKPLFLSGLYRVLLDLDNDTVLGDLNNGEIIFGNPGLPGKFAQAEFWFSFALPSWKSADFAFAELASDKNNITSITVTSDGLLWHVKVTLTTSSALEFKLSLSKKPSSGNVILADVQTMIDSTTIASVFVIYLKKIEKARDIVRQAIKALHERRNLCEDFPYVTTVDDEEIAFCFDVDVKPSHDIEKIQAEIFYAIENYLNPGVEFYSLKELMDKNIPVDEIFEGVVLQHGFIDTAQLETTQLRKVIHTSDIINILMDIEGVVAIRNFVMTKYDAEGKPVPGFVGQKWCMHITEFHKPVLSIARSKILLFKNQFPFIARYDEVRDTISLLHAQRSRDKLNGQQDDLLIPAGSKRDTESYWPVQYGLPQTYGVGLPGLPAHANVERTAKQRQLKAYLMFFEQAMADLSSQVSNAHALFSTANIKHTYFAQFLGNIKDIENIYKKSGATVLLEDTIVNADSTVHPKNAWQHLYETKHAFEDRRSRFLDHLLARFAESFEDYTLLMYRINYDEKVEEKIDFAELTDAKIRTLKNYDDISSNRGRAYNYFPQKPDFTVDTTKLWDTENVSGLEKRISFLTGIEDFTRRFLYCIKNIEIVCNEKSVKENGEEKLKCFHSFSITSLDGVQLNSTEYENKSEAEEAVKKIIEEGGTTANYVVEATGSEFVISLSGILKSIQKFSSEQTADDAIAAIASEMLGDCNDAVGLHLIEHILLRPREVMPVTEKNFDLMTVCLDDCECLCEMDPYSFRCSVVLPYWPKHFDNFSFREYFENKIRQEAPAHVMLKICWLNNSLMREFEIRYKKWVGALADYAYDRKANLISLRNANDKMIEILARLHSEYPTVTLHDCDESKAGSNTVVLGKTVLGTFNN